MAQVSPVEVEKHLKGIKYPTNKRELIAHAQQQGAGQNVLEVLKGMGEEQFNSPIDVSKAISEAEHK